MSTVIRVRCPIHGELGLRPDQVTLTITDPSSLSTYVFRCPACEDDIRKPADAHVITLLVTAHCPTVVLEVPAEAREPHAGPALTIDDLLDLLLDLATV